MSKINNGAMFGALIVIICAVGTEIFLRHRKFEKKQSLLEQCKSELKLCGDKFEGLYGATAWLMQNEYSVQEAEELCFRWESRLENDDQTAGLRKKWEQIKAHEVKKHIKKWYDLLVTVGVKKCVEEEVLVDRTMLQKYDLPDEAGNYMGKKMHVEVPCWMLEEKVLEKGTLV